MTKETSLIPTLQPTQVAVIQEKTPKEFLKTRPGRGGKNFTYVEVGYIINQLNKAFTPLGWDFEAIEQQITAGQVWVKGKLTIKLSPDYTVVKTGYGGSDVKVSADGKPVDVGDDLKAAASDALKKAASLLGIAADVYFPQLDMDFADAQDGEFTREPLEDNIVQQVFSTPITHITPSHAAKVPRVDECAECSNPITEKVKEFSEKKFGRPICFECQKTATV